MPARACLLDATCPALKLAADGAASPGRHCHSTLPLTAIGCHSVGIHTLILLSLLSLSVEIQCRPWLGAADGAAESDACAANALCAATVACGAGCA